MRAPASRGAFKTVTLHPSSVSSSLTTQLHSNTWHFPPRHITHLSSPQWNLVLRSPFSPLMHGEPCMRQHDTMSLKGSAVNLLRDASRKTTQNLAYNWCFSCSFESVSAGEHLWDIFSMQVIDLISKNCLITSVSLSSSLRLGWWGLWQVRRDNYSIIEIGKASQISRRKTALLELLPSYFKPCLKVNGA